MKLYLFFAQLIATCGGLSKRANLTLLQVYPATHEGCAPAIQVAINEVNSRSDILPDYNIVSDFRDEEGFFLGYAPVRELIRYSREWENRRSDALVRAPIMVGPFFSIACKPLGNTLHHLNAVSISIACTAPQLANHVSFPNLYLAMPTGQLIAMSLVHFIKDIGKWSRFALVTSASSPSDYATAIAIHSYAAMLNISVPYFNIILDTTEDIFVELTARDIRIVVVYVTEGPRLWKFICIAHRFGMRGPKFTFILSSVAVVNPRTIQSNVITEEWCTRAMIGEMMLNSIFIGSVISVIDESRATDLGYNTTDFDERLAQLMPVHRRDKSLTASSFKYVCHDAALMALFALHDAEQNLKTNYNMSLRDMNSNPGFVSKVVNSSVLNVNRSGLRGQLQFSKLGYNENDKIVYQRRIEDRFSSFFYSEETPNSAPGFYHGKYRFRSTDPSFNWSAWTSNGKPPKDSSSTVFLTDEVPLEVFASAAALAFLLTVVQLSVSVVSMIGRNDPEFGASSLAKVFGYCGCLLLNGVAISYATKTSLAVSFARIVLTFISMSMTNGVLSFRVIFLRRRCKQIVERSQPNGRDRRVSFATKVQPSTGARRMTIAEGMPGKKALICPKSSLSAKKSDASNMTSLYRFSSSSSTISGQIRLTEMEEGISKKIVIASTTFVVMNIAILLCWLLFESFRCFERILNNASYYDSSTDTKFQVSEVVCQSGNNVIWLGLFAFLHASTLLYAIYNSYVVKKTLRVTVTRQCRELTAITIGCINAVTLIAALSFVILTLDTEVEGHIAISFGSLLYSATNSGFWSYITIKKVMAKFKLC